MLPGISRLDYEGSYWPANIVSIDNKETCRWLEEVLWLVPLPSRHDGYDPLLTKNITPAVVEKLAQASAKAWDAVVRLSSACRGGGNRC